MGILEFGVLEMPILETPVLEMGILEMPILEFGLTELVIVALKLGQKIRGYICCCYPAFNMRGNGRMRRQVFPDDRMKG